MEVLPLAAATGVALLPGRVAAMVTGVLGLAGVLLSIAGLYGVVAYSAARRTREIGIRLALGAQRADVLRLIVREGMRLTLFGMVIGLGLAALAAPLLRSLLFGMSPLDPGTFLLMPAALASVALLASYLPARRAAATEPMVVLRGE
jgi:ABC-type antimicrobial peptide transport system permease subunit